MYKIFRQNLNNYFSLNKSENTENEFRLKIAEALKGLADKSLYDKWAIENPKLYEETKNLIYEIERNIRRFHPFECFSQDLWGLGYEARKSDKFPNAIVEEQLKLINLLLGTQYWVEI